MTCKVCGNKIRRSVSGICRRCWDIFLESIHDAGIDLYESDAHTAGPLDTWTVIAPEDRGQTDTHDATQP